MHRMNEGTFFFLEYGSSRVFHFPDGSKALKIVKVRPFCYVKNR
ncbi:hypothetical protein QY97_03967 [Bacillus thermotolerans]|uniref:Uncharacterized protein n=1 Tax=Bacillus thermotolerans TaxID=1221996 RepID=A0A0F5ICW7_BACTR|nr:hypothetical protein QY97_03967 [Bacillus thermotolerans]KKB42168.1 hypothetical protein QY96_01449 [Bacillus thermotolerans]KKB43303.1 hypothetical protein QY95_01548 [Bacillus thermotolerans]